MADKIIGLYGTGKGPQIPCFGREASVEVGGLKEDDCIAVMVDGNRLEELVGDGKHSIGPASHLVLEYKGEYQFVSCFVELE